MPSVTPDEARRELGLPTDASPAQIKAAWRRLVSRWHPDRNPDPLAVQRIQRFNEALACLQSPPPEPPAHNDEAPSSPPPSIEQTVELTLEQAIFGSVHTLNGRLSPVCATCHGSGKAPGPPQACPRCKGRGRIHHVTWFVWGGFTDTCPDCDGSGEFQPDCPACGGQGHAGERPWQLRVRLPAGLHTGDVLTVPTPGRDLTDPPGDVQLHIQVRPHALFTWDDDDVLHLDMPVDGFAWMAERWIEVPVPGGWQHMRLRRQHVHYRLRGQGVAVQRGESRGELVIHITPVFPEELTPEQNACIDQLCASLRTHPPAALADWHTRLHPFQPPAV